MGSDVKVITVFSNEMKTLRSYPIFRKNNLDVHCVSTFHMDIDVSI